MWAINFGLPENRKNNVLQYAHFIDEDTEIHRDQVTSHGYRVS